MNKKYVILILVSAFAMFSTALKSQEASIVIRIDTESDVMKEHTGSTSKDKATIVQRGSSDPGELLQWGTPNISFEGEWYTSAARLYNKTVAGGALQYPNYPYLEIRRTGDNEFTHIEITGSFDEATSSYSMIPMGFGEDGITFSDFQSDEPYLYFGGDLNMPSPGSYAAPAGAFDADYNMITKIPVPEGVDYIRIAASNKSFSGMPLGSGFDPAYIYQISLWTKDNGIPSSISNLIGDSFRVYVSNDVLTLTESGTVFIYNVSGASVASAGNIQTLPLSSLPSGIYIVKATSNTGKTLVTKIAVN
jgi:hypothetical protein